MTVTWVVDPAVGQYASNDVIVLSCCTSPASDLRLCASTAVGFATVQPELLGNSIVDHTLLEFWTEATRAWYESAVLSPFASPLFGTTGSTNPLILRKAGYPELTRQVFVKSHETWLSGAFVELFLKYDGVALDAFTAVQFPDPSSNDAQVREYALFPFDLY